MRVLSTVVNLFIMTPFAFESITNSPPDLSESIKKSDFSASSTNSERPLSLFLENSIPASYLAPTNSLIPTPNLIPFSAILGR